MYDKHHICGYNVQDAEKYAISDNVLHYGYVRCNNQVYDGSVGFQQFKKHVWSEEEQAALIKLGRVYGLIFNKELTKELNDNLFESLRAEEIMKYRAEHDALTGIPNRIGFDEMIGRLKKSNFRWRLPWSMWILLKLSTIHMATKSAIKFLLKSLKYWIALSVLLTVSLGLEEMNLPSCLIILQKIRRTL